VLTKGRIWLEGFPPRRPFFYVANLGAIGPIESGMVGRFFSSSAPITAILGVCAMSEKPQVWGGQIQIRKMLNACLIFDHRAMHPNTPIKFLTQLKRNLEEPDTYLV
jgi:pyruvate/2-oxoglutarate dehydrogenase complex dihydrolipoamide acyltransferase (E2) component